MTDISRAIPQPRRPEFVRENIDRGAFGVVEKPLTAWERIYNVGAVRKLFILAALAGAGYSIKVLLMGYAAGIGLAALLTVVAITSRIGNDFLETMTSMLNPLPAIALLPLALIWFGLGNASLVFVLIHSVLWPVALNTHSGFLAVSTTLRMVGRNAGLTGLRYVITVLMPAAFPSILTGMKIGWAFAWRTLIAAELVFGVSSSSGGLGWFIYVNKNDLEIPNVFAGLFTVILIGLFVENVIFRNVELKTVRKWGMQT
ncbi:MAG: ABC transporter permease subunit [Betaproteobacteria bacterium]|nr:ABC transporter permease subunit [Betaproteobacteria bacterium]